MKSRLIVLLGIASVVLAACSSGGASSAPTVAPSVAPTVAASVAPGRVRRPVPL